MTGGGVKYVVDKKGNMHIREYHANQPHVPDVDEDFSRLLQCGINDLKTFNMDDLKLLASFMGVAFVGDGDTDNYDIDGGDRDELIETIAPKMLFVYGNGLQMLNRKKCENYARKVSKEELHNARTKIYNRFAEYRNSVTSFTSNELVEMFKMYDELIFKGDIKKYITESDFTLHLKTKGEKTFTTEGICITNKCVYTITIPIHHFRHVRGVHNGGGMTNVAGQMCKDQLECLLRVMEHEITHLIIFMFCGDPFATEQHGELFKTTAKNLFHHTDHRHYMF